MRVPVLALVLLAGCVAPSVDPAPTPDAKAGPVAVALEGCAILEALVRLDAGAASAHVPAGFALGARQPDGSILGVLGAASCATGGARGFFGFGVRPEDEALENESVDAHFWLVEHHVQEGGAFAEAVAALAANASRARVDATAGATGAGFRVETEGWTHAARATPGNAREGLGGAFGSTFREWFAAEGGYGYLQASFAPGGASSLLPALVEPGPGSPAHALIGGPRPTAMFALEGAAYADASVGFVPYP